MSSWATESTDADRRTIGSVEFILGHCIGFDPISHSSEHTDRFQFRSEQLRRNSGRQCKLDERSTAHCIITISAVWGTVRLASCVFGVNSWLAVGLRPWEL